MIAPRGSALVRRSVENPRGISPWEQPHPDDVAELARRDAMRAAKQMLDRATGNQPGRACALAALRGEAQNVIDATRTNDAINRATYKLRKKYVDSGQLTAEEVAQVIYEAAWEQGYHTHIVGTLASALGITRGEVERLVTR